LPVQLLHAVWRRQALWIKSRRDEPALTIAGNSVALLESKRTERLRGRDEPGSVQAPGELSKKDSALDHCHAGHFGCTLKVSEQIATT
jgi:hypothetical protein